MGVLVDSETPNMEQLADFMMQSGRFISKKICEIVLNREYDNKVIIVEREFYLDKRSRTDLLLS